ncbi:MAG: YqaJ viral recombinase family protein [Moraxella sp.]|nr:YqaJ viral recombinase family protein [Moraxella sp.]
MEQRTEGWYTARVGKITASRIKDLSAKPKAGKCLNDTLTKILAERLSGEPTPTAKNKAMDWGIQCEPLARQAYELATFCTVVEVGLIDHPSIPMSGASPDGLVGDDGLIEIKCPETATHTNTLLTGQVPNDYLPQIAWQLACTGRDWCDFVSFDPRMPSHLQIKIIRINRSDVDIEALERDVMRANEILTQAIKELNHE